jgi:transcriptional repressor NrdR
MHCPFCDAEKESLKVIDSRTCEGGKAIRRRRECLRCGKRFTTYERIEESIRLVVVKKDGRRIPWDKQKILVGLQRACFKRPVPESELLRIRDEVEEEVVKTYDREVSSDVVGRLVIERLRRVDQVAYVRFASVYRRFKTVEELMDEARALIDARRDEDPDQGRLFNEDRAPLPPVHPVEPEPKPTRIGRSRRPHDGQPSSGVASGVGGKSNGESAEDLAVEATRAEVH